MEGEEKGDGDLQLQLFAFPETRLAVAPRTPGASTARKGKIQPHQRDGNGG